MSTAIMNKNRNDTLFYTLLTPND